MIRGRKSRVTPREREHGVCDNEQSDEDDEEADQDLVFPCPCLPVQYLLFVPCLFPGTCDQGAECIADHQEERGIIDEMKERMVSGVMIIQVNPPFGCGFMHVVLPLPVTCNCPGRRNIDPRRAAIPDPVVLRPFLWVCLLPIRHDEGVPGIHRELTQLQTCPVHASDGCCIICSYLL